MPQFTKLGSDVKLLALSPSPRHILLQTRRGRRRTRTLIEKNRQYSPPVPVLWSILTYISVGRRLGDGLNTCSLSIGHENLLGGPNARARRYRKGIERERKIIGGDHEPNYR